MITVLLGDMIWSFPITGYSNNSQIALGFPGRMLSDCPSDLISGWEICDGIATVEKSVFQGDVQGGGSLEGVGLGNDEDGLQCGLSPRGV